MHIAIQTIQNERLLNKARSLNATGTVVQEGNYSYLKISDEYIHQLFTLIPLSYYALKPDYFSPNNNIGAHITIVYPEENLYLRAEDIGKSHSFAIESFNSAQIMHKKYFVLLISSPTLKQLRLKYGRSEKLWYKNISIEFHITIGYTL